MNKELFREEKSTDNVTLFYAKVKNQKKETLLIELIRCENNVNYSRSLPNVWYKNGYTNRILETYWCVNTYVTDSEGRCWEKYNIQNKLSEDGKRMVIDFDWMFEATEENKEKLLNAIYQLFFNATGKSATEKKIDNIKQYAKDNNLEIVTEIPEGWVKLNYCTDPVGCVSIGNTNKTLKAIKEGTFKRKLLLV